MFALAMLLVRFTAGALVCASLLGSATAFAQDADALIKQGVELRREGKDQEALEQFRRAFEVAPTPRALAQMALAEQALGRWVDAEAHVGKALEAARDPWIEKYRATLEQSREKISEHLGSLAVSGGPDGAALRVDGQVAGTLPLRGPLRLPTGTVSLEVSSQGHVLALRTVSIAPGLVTREDLGSPSTLISPSAAAPGSTPMPASPTAGTSGGDAAPVPASSGRRTLEWIGAGAAVGLGVVGASFWLAGRHDASEYNNGTCRMTPALASCTTLHSAGERDYAIDAVTWIAAGALGVTAAVLYLTTPESAGAGERRVACVPAFASDQAGAACALRF
jgi:hypothetical protein